MFLVLGLWGSCIIQANWKEKKREVGILFSGNSLKMLSGFEHLQCICQIVIHSLSQTQSFVLWEH